MFGLVEEEGLITLYLAALFLPALFCSVLGTIRNNGLRRISIALVSVSCLAGTLCYPLWMAMGDLTAVFPLGSFWGDYSILIDRLSAVFISVSSLVFLMIMLHSARSGYGNGYTGLCGVLFISCTLCMCADTVFLLLIAWEIVSMTTFIMGDNGDNDIPRWRFFAITHIGGLILMAVYGYLWMVSGTQILHEWDSLSLQMGSTVTCILALLIFIGFGTKLGMIPFHAWMPEMYSESPTHTAALLTTVCSNAAVLILFKTVFSYIGMDGASVCGWIVCLLSSLTALWGAMESMIQTDPKKILAYSSMENMALVTMCLSLAILFSGEIEALSSLAIVAAMLHTLNHSVFKSLMLMTVDSVERSTGESRMDRFGGLAKVLPGLSVVALIGVFALASIPPVNGFFSEWMMLQTLIGTDAVSSDMRVVMPLLIAMMGTCGAIVATSYARLYGFIFLGRPKSKGAAEASPINKSQMVSLAVLAGSCIAAGVFAMNIMDVLSEGTLSLTGFEHGYREALSGTMESITFAIMIGGAILLVYVLANIRKKNRRTTDTWGCGGTLDERMQYSSEGFSEPIVKMFHPFYGDRSQISNHRVITSFKEPFIKYIYIPMSKGVMYVSKHVTSIQTGNIQSYLAYILITLVIALLAVRLI